MMSSGQITTTGGILSSVAAGFVSFKATSPQVQSLAACERALTDTISGSRVVEFESELVESA